MHYHTSLPGPIVLLAAAFDAILCVCLAVCIQFPEFYEVKADIPGQTKDKIKVSSASLFTPKASRTNTALHAETVCLNCITKVFESAAIAC